jgi:hypothetical protein
MVTHHHKAYKNKLRTTIRASKQLYYKNAFIDSRRYMKHTWSLVNNILSRNYSKKSVKSLLINGVSVTDEMVIANEFNTYFSTIATEISSQLPHSNISPLASVRADMPSSFFLNAVTPGEISNIIFNLKKSSSDLHSLPVKVLIQVRNLLSIPISNLVNNSFTSGKFPSLLKLAKVLRVVVLV